MFWGILLISHTREAELRKHSTKHNIPTQVAATTKKQEVHVKSHHNLRRNDKIIPAICKVSGRV